MKILKMLAALSPFGEYYYLVSEKSNAKNTGIFKVMGKFFSIVWLVWIAAFILCMLFPIPGVPKLFVILVKIFFVIFAILLGIFMFVGPIVITILLYKLSKISKENCSEYELKFFKYKKFRYIALLILGVAVIISVLLKSDLLLFIAFAALVTYKILGYSLKINLYKIIK